MDVKVKFTVRVGKKVIELTGEEARELYWELNMYFRGEEDSELETASWPQITWSEK